MWIPQTEDEVNTVVLGGALEEGPAFDAKKEVTTKSLEIAKDVAAMANDGGVLIYGIDEDANNRPTLLNPIPLPGQAERINSIVQTSITPPPIVHITTIQTKADPSKGYIVVHVPQSEYAPHQVTVKGDLRYYGRSATGNTPLFEGDIDRLYTRRRRWEIDRDAMLEEEISRAPYQPNENFAYLHLIAKPISRIDDLLSRIQREHLRVEHALIALIDQVRTNDVFPSEYFPDFDRPDESKQLVDGFLLKLCTPRRKDAPDAPGDTLNLQIDSDGKGHLFCGRAAENEDGKLLFFPRLVAGNTTRFLTLLGELYKRANYGGMVDIGLGLTGIKNTVLRSPNPIIAARITPYDQNKYTRTTRVSAINLKDMPQTVAKTLLMPIFGAMSQGKLDPFPPSN
jgi:hypothetical protein